MNSGRFLVCAFAGMCFGAAAPHAAEYPGRTVEMVVAGNAGGGLDLLGRGLESALREQKLLKEALVIRNMGGAGGNLAKSFIHQKKGDPYFIYVESNRIYLNRIVGTTNLSHADVTPLARIATEYLVWAVRADSPHKSARDILEKLKANPASVVFGVGTLPGNDQMNILRPAIALGVDAKQVKIVPFKSGGDLMIQLLGGHVPVISTGFSEALEQVKAGKVRLVAVSAPGAQVGELASVPSWKSLGIDVAILHWRGLFAPPGVPAEAVRFWDQALSKMVKSDSWKKILERHEWFDAYADSATFRHELDQEARVYAEILGELGMAKGTGK